MRVPRFGLVHWQDDDKSGAFARFALRGYQAAMAVGNAAADRQADAGALVFPAAVQPLEHGENLFQILLLESNAVVLRR